MRCHHCEREGYQQLCGFWFCFWCLPRASKKGASYWRRLYKAVYPWR